MTKREAQEELRKKTIELAKLFYETEYNEILSSVTYLEIGCPYRGEVSPMEIHVFYKNNSRPEKRDF